jgi:hypothetical protein
MQGFAPAGCLFEVRSLSQAHSQQSESSADIVAWFAILAAGTLGLAPAGRMFDVHNLSQAHSQQSKSSAEIVALFANIAAGALCWRLRLLPCVFRPRMHVCYGGRCNQQATLHSASGCQLLLITHHSPLALIILAAPWEHERMPIGLPALKSIAWMVLRVNWRAV